MNTMIVVRYVNAYNGRECDAYFGDEDDANRFADRLTQLGHTVKYRMPWTCEE